MYENLSIDELNELKKKFENEKAFAHIQQYNRKILMNSLYGSISNKYFRWFDIRIAKSITLMGQYYIKTIAKDLNNFLNKQWKTDKEYLVAGDTDSVYFDMSKALENFEGTDKEKTFKLKKFSEDMIEPFIKKRFKEYGKSFNIFNDKMEMKRENVIKEALWTGKKYYIAKNLLNDADVYDENRDYKIMGLPLIKSDTPKAIKPILIKSLEYIFKENEGEMQEFIQKFKRKFSKSNPEKIAVPKGIKNVEKYKNKTDELHNLFKKGCPIHVRGSIFHNWLIDHKNKNKEKIKSASKIFYVYLKKNNPYKQHVISFLDEFPEDLIEKKYIDYDIMFEKTFLSNIEILTRVLNWNITNLNNNISLFS